MSELAELARPLIDAPLVERPDVSVLGARSRRRQSRRLTGLSVFLVVAVIGAIGLTQLGNTAHKAPTTDPVHLTSYFKASINVPDSTLAAVGLPPSVSVPTRVTPTVATATTNQVVSYVGAEYCPYCAIQRWALLVALSQFGTFSNLSDQVLSSSSKVYPNLASWSFIGARYTSPYFTFDPTELTSSVLDGHGYYQSLEKMSAAQEVAYDHFDPQGGLPFVDLGNESATIGASASPSVLEGFSLGQIGSSLSDPTSPVAQAVDGTANYLIAAMCTMVVTGTKPSICSTSTTTQALSALDSGVPPTGSASSNNPPVQPPTNAPMSVWQKWSDEQHAFWEQAAANYHPMTRPGCAVINAIDVDSITYTKTTLGIPPRVKVWYLSVVDQCSQK
ncbi:MAG: DUF929 family protein [Acidimicrobiales bacterium]